MTRPASRCAALVLSALTLVLAGCSVATTRLERALDPSMERALLAANYLQTAAGITADARRIVRGDGYVYLADVGPQLQYLAMTGDSASYRALRRFAERDMVLRDAVGVRPRRRARQGAPFEEATPFGALRFAEALALGWRTYGDSASAVLTAQLAPVPAQTASNSETDQAAERCVTAEATLAVDAAQGAAVVRRYRRYTGRRNAETESALGLRGDDASLVALACLTRMSLSLKDPDASVHFLDAMLRHLDPMVTGSGRPDAGAAADILLALRQALAAGPSYATARR